MSIAIMTHIDTAARNQLQDLLNNNPNLFFNERLFEVACKDLGQLSEAESWSRDLSPFSAVEDMINAIPEEMRVQFIKLYIYHFNRHLTV
jgi:hypothetical protein